MAGPVTLEALDLAALLCSRVCHDLISPVGAVVNGLEVLEEGKDEETRTFALDLIKKSAQQASARLQFCRLAFGAAGSSGAQIDLGDGHAMARKGEAGRALALKAAGIQSGAALGFIGAIGACGGYLIPSGFGKSIAITGGPQLALEIYLAFYAVCLAITWWFYLRRSAVTSGATSLAEARV